MNIEKNLANLMEEAKKMQQNMQQAQEVIANMTAEGHAGGKDKISVKINGRYEVLNVKISDNLMEGEVEILQDLIAAAFNDAVRKIETASRSKINELTKGLNLPGDLG
jgi:DNA-binding YbaB/EbfC family protein